MISKNKQKFVTSLTRKKIRDELGLFVAEGDKLVNDLINSEIKPHMLICTDEWYKNNDTNNISQCEIVISDIQEIKKITILKSPPPVIGIFKQNTGKLITGKLKNGLNIFLDEIQDPGNLGTIIRLADWFGIKNIICSTGCADIYNPKTIQSTMGAISRVDVFYTDPVSFLSEYKNLNLPVYGTFLDGKNIYTEETTASGLIVMGNEGKGISAEVESFINKRLFIPPFPAGARTSESLNVSVATAIVCAEFRRPTKQ